MDPTKTSVVGTEVPDDETREDRETKEIEKGKCRNLRR